jgi:hypothetical protein
MAEEAAPSRMVAAMDADILIPARAAARPGADDVAVD